MAGIPRKVQCPYCPRLISANNLWSHIKSHESGKLSSNYKKNDGHVHLDHDDLFCKYCGKEHKSKMSLIQHEIRCPKNPDRKDFNNFGNYSTNFRKGKTKENCEEIARQAAILVELHKQGVYKNVAWPLNTSKGKGSYIKYKDKKYLCRSTYEFIYALYLLANKIEFEMEAIRAPAIRENMYAKTFISDFSYGNKVIEVKGRRMDKIEYEQEAFEALGYEFEVLYWPEINKCKQWLIDKGFDMEDLIAKIYEGVKNKQYFVYEYIDS